MISQENPYLNRPELMYKVPVLVHRIESDIQRYLTDGVDTQVERLQFDAVNQRIMYAEGPTWQRRRDASDTALLIYYRFKDLEESKVTQQALNIDFGYDSLSYHFSPTTILALIRQQIYNWRERGEEHSEITVYDVQAALQRHFYMAYKGAKRKESYEESRIIRLYDLCELIDQAVKVDEEYQFEPDQPENVLEFGDFMKKITSE